MTDFSAEVSRGVALLDRVKPDWRESVNPETLNIGDESNCILGQVFGDFHDGVYEVYLASCNTTQHQRYGFDFDAFPDTPEYRHAIEALKTEWLTRL